MNIAVKHNGNTITGRVISYEREHKICTGIGTLQIILEGTYSTAIAPWDTIDIWENGSFKVKYYVSNVSHSVPDGTITLDCQDKSKRLVDYFISQSYTIDYPSYTRYWIEKFLTEAGISYDFRTTSQGNLLSNYTALGLQPAYDQIMMLLQLSGWYMFFDGNGVAVIGPLDTDLAISGGSLSTTDIIDIKKISNDKMLRNRAVVWGAFDPDTQTYAFADVSKTTAWNYDRRDMRTMVISNHNIPNKNSAYGIANQLIKEFAKITVEKHIVAWGARNFTLGKAINVRSNIWRGRGLITTFGVSMSRAALVTNIILDERCPRLFGFFDFGDYVYVGTFGDGVWRKHIKFDPTWYNFSTGLTDLNITDMHINNEIFGSVAANGSMYYANTSEGPWHQVSVTGLMSSSEDTVVSGAITYVGFSGIMARATIVDKLNNIVKFGVDTWSGMNTGDYFLTYSGMITSSGVTASGYRGWILEYDPFTGQPIGELGSGIYPISVSGNYNLRVLDLENDGLNDFVSVATIGVGISGDDELQEYNYGYGGVTEQRPESKISISTLTDDPDSKLVSESGTSNVWQVGMIDNVGEHEFFYIVTSGGNIVFWLRKYQTNNLLFDQTSSALINLTANKIPMQMNASTGVAQIIKVGTNKYRFIVRDQAAGTVQLAEITDNGGGSLSQSYSTIFTNGTYDGDLISFHSSTQNDKQAIIALINRHFGSPEDFDYKIWYITVNLEAATWSTHTLVYSSGGTSLAQKYVNFRVYPYDDGFQTIGFQAEGNTNPRDVYTLSGTGLGVNKGALIANGTVNKPFTIFNEHSLRLSRTWASLTTDIGGTRYINYGVHSYETISSTDDLVVGNLVASSFDGRVFRVRPSTATGSGLPELQVNTLPISTGWTNISLGSYKPRSNVFFRMDTIEPAAYIYVTPIAGGASRILGLNPDTYAVQKDIIMDETATSTTNPGSYRPYNVGNMVLTAFPNGVNIGFEFRVYKNLTPALGSGSSYLVLRREGSDFNLIQQSTKPIRIDISNTSPELSVNDFHQTFVSNYVYENELTVVIPTLASGNRVDDYRYVLMEPIASGYTVSGYPAVTTILYITGSGIYGTDALTYSGGFTKIFDVPSGYGTRIETSNYGLNGQYVFIVASGGYQTFYQKNPTGLFGVEYFTEYSGLPQSRATIIRLDDYL